MSFNKDFVWGVATAAYQIEGAYNEDGRGLSVWDGEFAQDKTYEKQTGNIACDHYHRYKEDVALMKSLGVKNYRFSVSWPRVMPDGCTLNPLGVKFYQNLVKELKSAGIEPWVTIYHWDLPIKLFEQGGFMNDKISDYFTDYAEEVVKFLGEDVKNYIIFNEPQVVVEDGHHTGAHAPFLKLSRKDSFKVAHNVLLCIGKAEKAMRKAAGHKLNIGISPCYTPMMPINDEAAALKYNFTPNGEFYDGCFFTDAVIKGEFDPSYADWFKENDYNPSAEDMKVIKSDLDFFGVNMYRGFYVEKTQDGIKRKNSNGDLGITAMDWRVTPDACEYLVKYYYERYRLPVLITENGVALNEWKTLNGDIPDDMRIDYMHRYLSSLKKAAEKYPVMGYFYWTFMDNFEWTLGYSKRFGLVYVDYDTLERTPKKSAYWYKNVMETNGEDL